MLNCMPQNATGCSTKYWYFWHANTLATNYTRRGKITRDRCKEIKVREDEAGNKGREGRSMRGKVSNTR